MYDLLVRGGTVVTAESVAPLDVAVEGERIVAVAAPMSCTQIHSRQEW